jgi:hypothetical protein
MHPTEFWWLADAKTPPKRYGSMAESDVAELYEEMKKWGAFDG